MAPAAIEPAPLRFVTQHLNHCANAVPHLQIGCVKLKDSKFFFSQSQFALNVFLGVILVCHQSSQKNLGFFFLF